MGLSLPITCSTCAEISLSCKAFRLVGDVDEDDCRERETEDAARGSECPSSVRARRTLACSTLGERSL